MTWHSLATRSHVRMGSSEFSFLFSVFWQVSVHCPLQINDTSTNHKHTRTCFGDQGSDCNSVTQSCAVLSWIFRILRSSRSRRPSSIDLFVFLVASSKVSVALNLGLVCPIWESELIQVHLYSYGLPTIDCTRWGLRPEGTDGFGLSVHLFCPILSSNSPLSRFSIKEFMIDKSSFSTARAQYISRREQVLTVKSQ